MRGAPSRTSKAPEAAKHSSAFLPTARTSNSLTNPEKRLERAVFFSSLHDHLNCPEADALDGAEAEADLAVLDGEMGLAVVDRRRQHLQAELPRLLQHDGELVRRADLVRHGGGHELGREVRLEKGRLVGDDRVGS